MDPCNIVKCVPPGLSRVGLLGCASQMGYWLTMLLKQSPLISKINMYDSCSQIIGEAYDINHIDSSCQVVAHVGGKDALERTIQNSDIIVMLESKGLVERDTAKAVALHGPKMLNYARAICENNPRTIVAVCCDPVEAIMPIVSGEFMSSGWYDPSRILGSCAISEVRCNTAIARAMGLDPFSVNVPLVGGCSGCCLVPVFSQALPSIIISEKCANAILTRLRQAPADSACAPQAPLLTAHALRRFIVSLAAGRNGSKNVLCNAFVRSNILSCCEYLCSPVLLGKTGVDNILNIPRLNDWELNELSLALNHLHRLIKIGKSLSDLLGPLGSPKESIFNPNVLKAYLQCNGLLLDKNPCEDEISEDEAVNA